jgi:hypothetical protein
MYIKVNFANEVQKETQEDNKDMFFNRRRPIVNEMSTDNKHENVRNYTRQKVKINFINPIEEDSII